MNTAHHPFGGEAAVLYLAIIDQITRQGSYLTVADVYVVLNLLAAEASTQLAIDTQRTVMQQDQKEMKK